MIAQAAGLFHTRKRRPAESCESLKLLFCRPIERLDLAGAMRRRECGANFRRGAT